MIRKALLVEDNTFVVMSKAVVLKLDITHIQKLKLNHKLKKNIKIIVKCSSMNDFLNFF